MSHKILLLCLVSLLLKRSYTCDYGPICDPLSPEMNEAAPSVYVVEFDTTHGLFAIEVKRHWAPNSADRFFQLVKHGFYSNNYFYRVLPDFVAQWGISGDPDISAAWAFDVPGAILKPDPVSQGNIKGFVSFSAQHEDSHDTAVNRTTQVFINLVDNLELDALGFAPFGQVISGMADVIPKLYSDYGENLPACQRLCCLPLLCFEPKQHEILSKGNIYLEHEYPLLSRIHNAYIKSEGMSGARIFGIVIGSLFVILLAYCTVRALRTRSRHRTKPKKKKSAKRRDFQLIDDDDDADNDNTNIDPQKPKRGKKKRFSSEEEEDMDLEMGELCSTELPQQDFPRRNSGASDSDGNESSTSASSLNSKEALCDEDVDSEFEELVSQPDFSRSSSNNSLGYAVSPPVGGIAPASPSLQRMQSIFNPVRAMVSLQKFRFREDGFDLDLTYITPRIIAMGFPSQGKEGLYRNPISEVVRFFDTRHPSHYRVYNLCSEREYDTGAFQHQVEAFPFDDHNPPPFPMMLQFCKSVDLWLTADPENVVAIHCKAGKGRTGTMLCCYLLYSGAHSTAKEALAFYGKARTSNGKGVTIPSQIRYVQYFDKSLGHPVTGDRPLLLQSISVSPVPSFSKNHGVKEPSFYILDRCSLAYNSHEVGPAVVYHDGATGRSLQWQPLNIRVSGDVKIEFFHRKTKYRKNIFSLWFNTLFIDGDTLTLEKSQVDTAHKDKECRHFPTDFRVELKFTAALP